MNSFVVIDAVCHWPFHLLSIFCDFCVYFSSPVEFSGKKNKKNQSIIQQKQWIGIKKSINDCLKYQHQWYEISIQIQVNDDDFHY